MIIGIGADICAIRRIKASVQRHGERFIEKIYTPLEIEDCRNSLNEWRYESLAARFAAKEAFYKAFNPHTRKFIPSWHDFIVAKSSDGIPFPLYSISLQKTMEKLQWTTHLSLSHEKDQAIAMVVISSSSLCN